MVGLVKKDPGNMPKVVGDDMDDFLGGAPGQGDAPAAGERQATDPNVAKPQAAKSAVAAPGKKQPAVAKKTSGGTGKVAAKQKENEKSAEALVLDPYLATIFTGDEALVTTSIKLPGGLVNELKFYIGSAARRRKRILIQDIARVAIAQYLKDHPID